MLNIAGAEFYLVGGCVRDKLLGRKVKDHDYVVVTDLSFDELAAALEAAGAIIFVRKPEFLTLRVRIGKGETVDIAFPRVDGEYKDGRRPESVSSATSLKQDAARRDFTINAMYLDQRGEVVDFFDGKKDLQRHRIRAVGDPNTRFQEDFLRILRAVRFACVLDFDIEPATYTAMLDQRRGLGQITADRIREELDRSLLANPYRTFQFLSDLNLWDVLTEKGLTFELTQRERQ